MKMAVSSAYKHSYTFPSAFPWAGDPTSACSSNTLCVLLTSLHKILRRPALNGWDLVKVIFTASPRAFLSENNFACFLLWTCDGKE